MIMQLERVHFILKIYKIITLFKTNKKPYIFVSSFFALLLEKNIIINEKMYARQITIAIVILEKIIKPLLFYNIHYNTKKRI